jgi:hypothetical protein
MLGALAQSRPVKRAWFADPMLGRGSPVGEPAFKHGVGALTGAAVGPRLREWEEQE